ncbi:branched-chain amino acid ABC transporter permease [Bradyrhizobium sp.]|uniref:branched-chain amino acid ABC transporter permease n=1 Tax=Bradyrhizobium sp. TaxID=376 RepID=UPI0039E37E0B
MDVLINQVVSGIVNGGIYASLALALVMIYQATGLVNFAQGDMAMFSTFIAWSMITSLGIPYWPAFALTLLASFAIGFGVQRIVVRPFEGRSVLAAVIVFIGLQVIFNSVAGGLFDYTTKSFPSPFPAEAPFGNRYVSSHDVGSLCVTLVTVVVLYVFFRYTKLGLAMRASALNPVSCRLSGVPVGLMLATGWGLAGLLGAIAGMMVAPVVYLDPNMMSGVMIYAIAAAKLGGIDNPWGAVAGGFIIGILENLVGAYVVGTELKLSIALLVIIGVLILKPAGLFGRKIVTRV